MILLSMFCGICQKCGREYMRNPMKDEFKCFVCARKERNLHNQEKHGRFTRGQKDISKIK